MEKEMGEHEREGTAQLAWKSNISFGEPIYIYI
jgi:hypothetical protein